MAKVSSAAGGGEMGDGTVLVLFGGVALLVVGGVWYAQKQVEKSVAYIEDLPREILGGAGQAGTDILDRVAESGEYYGKQTSEAKRVAYETEKTTTAQVIEAERADAGFSNYGTVNGSLGPYTGKWFKTLGKPGDSCHLLYANSSSSNATKFFTGSYCRQARAQGLIE